MVTIFVFDGVRLQTSHWGCHREVPGGNDNRAYALKVV